VLDVLFFAEALEGEGELTVANGALADPIDAIETLPEATATVEKALVE